MVINEGVSMEDLYNCKFKIIFGLLIHNVNVKVKNLKTI